MSDEKPRVRFDMKYIGWNLGATRVERNKSIADIEILSMTIDDVDILQQLEKLEAVKTWLKDAPTPLFLVPGQSPFISETEMEVWLENCPLKILEAEG